MTTTSKPSVFISYRQEDAAGWAGRIEDDLSDHFGGDRVWRDIKLRPGVDYEDHIERILDTCHVVVVVIGPRWTTIAAADGTPRLLRDGDLLRREVQRALERRDVDVFPVLVQKASMPEPHELPADLQPLLRRQAIELSDKSWRRDIAELVAELRRALEDTTGFHDEPKPVRRTSDRAQHAEPAELSGRERLIAASAMVCAAALGVLVHAPLTTGFAERRRFGQPEADRLVYFAAERAVMWGLVAALVLAAVAATLRRDRAGALGCAFIGLGVGVVGGALAGASYMVLKDQGIIASEHLLRGIATAIAGVVLALAVAMLVHGQRLVYVLAGLAAGLLAGILAQELLHEPGQSSRVGMVVFEAVLLTGALAAVATTASTAFAGRPGALTRT